MYSNWEHKYTKKQYLEFIKEINQNHIDWRRRAVKDIGREMKGGSIKQDGTPYTVEDFIAWVDESSKIHKESWLKEFGIENIDEVFYNEENDSFVTLPSNKPDNTF